MNISKYINNAVIASRQKTLATSDQLTLGEIILKLEPIVKSQALRIAENKSEATVIYDFAFLYPTEIDSWRGIYAELALNYVDADVENKPRMKVTEFYNMMQECIGKSFTGYKGGDFTMSKDTPVWIANYGKVGSTAVIDIIDNDYAVIIMTGYREY